MRQRKKSLNVQDPGPDPAQDPVQDPVLMIVDVGPDVQVNLKETKKNSNICIRSWHISTDSYITILIRVVRRKWFRWKPKPSGFRLILVQVRWKKSCILSRRKTIKWLKEQHLTRRLINVIDIFKYLIEPLF